MLNVYVRNDDGLVHTANIHVYKMMDHLVDSGRIFALNLSDLVGKSTAEMQGLVEGFRGDCDSTAKSPVNLIVILFAKQSPLFGLRIPDDWTMTVMVDDIHIQGLTKQRYLTVMNRSAKILSTYGYCFPMFFSGLQSKTFFLPHSTQLLTEINPSPDPRLLLSGRINSDIYPLRSKVFKLSKMDPRVSVLSTNCPYRMAADNPNMTYGARYIEYLRRFLACFVCDASHRRPYILAKHFEIAGSGSLLVAGNPNTKTVLETLGFIDRINYFSVTEETLNTVINYVLDEANREEIDRVRTAGWLLVKNRHTYLQRGEDLMKILDGSEQ